MGSLLSTLGLGSSSGDQATSSSYNSVLQCCDGVVDPLTLLAVLGSIIGVTIFLRQAIIDKVAGRKRRKREIDSIPNQMYNLFQLDHDESIKTQLYESMVSVSTRLLDGYTFYDIFIAGRLYLKICVTNLMLMHVNILSHL